jgi:hypothetical protein
VRFGKVSGYVVARGDGLWLSVSLESGRGLKAIREQLVPVLSLSPESATLDWQADQYTQETIAVDLAEQGWEAIAEEMAITEHPEGIGKSKLYTVRNLSGG